MANWSKVKLEKDGQVRSIEDANAWVRNKILYYVSEEQEYHWDSAPEETLQPWEGYWVKAVTSSCTLFIPPEETLKTGSLSRSFSSLNECLQVIAKLEGAEGDIKDSSNFTGFSSQAKDGYDVLDVEEAPPISLYVSLSFYHSDWGEDSGNYTQDIREKKDAPSQDRKVWLVVIESDQLDKNITLEWKNTGAIPSPDHLYLADGEGNVLLDIKEEDTYTFYSSSGEGMFQIIVTPSSLSPWQSHPNRGLHLP